MTEDGQVVAASCTFRASQRQHDEGEQYEGVVGDRAAAVVGRVGVRRMGALYPCPAHAEAPDLLVEAFGGLDVDHVAGPVDHHEPRA